MKALNRLFLDSYGEVDVLTGPRKLEELVSACINRQHLYFRVKFKFPQFMSREVVREEKIHVNVEEIGFLNPVSGTAMRVMGHLRGYVNKKVTVEYDFGGAIGKVIFH